MLSKDLFTRKEKSMGMIYKRGEVFWIKYYSGGKPIRESTGTSKQSRRNGF